jgi:oxygen-dependent protoporphyrinogen oxidase
MSALVDALTDALGDRVKLKSPIERIESTDDGCLVDGERFDAVIVTTPIDVAARALGDGDLKEMMTTVPLASVALVTLVFDDHDLGRALDGTGFLVPRPERRAITACSWFTSKWPTTKPPGRSVLRVSLGSIDDPDRANLDDQAMISAVMADLDRMMGLRATPQATRITRWPRSFPQYLPGHTEKVAAMRARLAAEHPNVQLAGAAYSGIGVPACIRQGREAADAVIAQWQERQ